MQSASEQGSCANSPGDGAPAGPGTAQPHLARDTARAALVPNPAQLWRTTINLSARGAGLFFCTPQHLEYIAYVYERDAWTICVKPSANSLPFPAAAPEPCSCCRFVFAATQGNTPRQNQTKIHFQLLEFLPPFNSQQLQPTCPLITTRFSSSCLEP